MGLKTVIIKILIRNWWLGMPTADRPASLSLSDINRLALQAAQFLASDFRVGKAMKELGFLKTRPMVDGSRVYFYSPSPELLGAQAVQIPKTTEKSIEVQRRRARITSRDVDVLYGAAPVVAPSAAGTVGTLLRAWRKEHGKTQTWLAKATGIEQALISKYENGTVPLPPNALKIEHATGGQVPLSYWYPTASVNGGV